MPRLQGRITREDIREAGLRRWDGRHRVTTDWINLYHEIELCFAHGDCLVYLREPGQSSRGPTFRVNISQLVIRGFRCLSDRAVTRPSLHPAAACTTPLCEGCSPAGLKELFLPAPPNIDLDAKIDHHLDTRNFFAWLYHLPLAGRSLGTSLIGLKRRIDEYRPVQKNENIMEVVAYMERHRYLDFRECVDHALAVLNFAEAFELEEMWVDAFAHCVGMSSKSMQSSREYQSLSKTTKASIFAARAEMDLRLHRVNASVLGFFESDLSSSTLGLPQPARDHLDRFRSFLQAYYIEQYGFWPPENFENRNVQQTVYNTLYSDFRNLYHHLVDSLSTPTMTTTLASSGGVCTLQNIQVFDEKHSFDALPHPLPKCPDVPPVESAQPSTLPRRTSLNPLRKRQVTRELRQELEAQALIDSSNRDWNIMRCLLVRRFSEFEQLSVLDEEKLSVVDARKVRWILIYAILQIMISVMQSPKQVRETEGLSYFLCCTVPKQMPWQVAGLSRASTSETSTTSAKIEPDMDLRLNLSSTSLKANAERRNSTLSRSSTLNAGDTSPIASGSTSLRRLLTRKSMNSEKMPATKRPAFCEIFVEGYGNGLNRVNFENDAIQTAGTEKAVSEETTSSDDTETTETPPTPPTTSASVSRESSSASGHSNRSSGTSNGTSSEAGMPDMDHLSVTDETHTPGGDMKVKDEHNLEASIHLNTETWDKILGV